MIDGGYYMYMEVFSLVVISNIVVLQYKILLVGQLFCVYFWYYMYGNSMGLL